MRINQIILLLCLSGIALGDSENLGHFFEHVGLTWKGEACGNISYSAYWNIWQVGADLVQFDLSAIISDAIIAFNTVRQLEVDCQWWASFLKFWENIEIIIPGYFTQLGAIITNFNCVATKMIDYERCAAGDCMGNLLKILYQPKA